MISSKLGCDFPLTYFPIMFPSQDDEEFNKANEKRKRKKSDGERELLYFLISS
jgi:hypothetical protein